MIKRRESKQISIGNIKVGGDAPVSVQSMCNTDTRDAARTLEQINELAAAGCDIVRLAVLNKDAAESIKEIVKKSPVPLVADIHFDYRLAIQCINNGIDALRLNPGNIGRRENVEKVVSLAKQQKIPIRIGVNAGSLEKELLEKDIPLSEKMVISAMKHIKILEDLDFDLIKVSLKSSDVLTTIEAYRSIAEKVPYPLHLGITEAGTLRGGLIKSSIGLGTLLAEGIGDTIRVSLTENPVEEVSAGIDILKAIGLKEQGVNFVSCPTCGRTQIDLINLAKKVEENKYPTAMEVGLIGSCTNSSYHDLSKAASIARQVIEKKLKVKAKIIINPGSEASYNAALRDGIINDFKKIGAVIMTNACGPCIGQWNRQEPDNTRANSIVTSFNRNFAKRADGNPNTHAFVASPETVMALSIAGDLRFNPLKDTLTNGEGKEVKLDEPVGVALPKNGLNTENKKRQNAPTFAIIKTFR